MIDLTCRFYRSVFPQPEECVAVQIVSMNDLCVNVTLLEYDQRPAMICFTELSRQRIRSIHRLVHIGRKEIALVLNVDSQKGNVDLSKRRVSDQDMGITEERFARARIVNTVLLCTAKELQITTKEEFEELYRQTAWFYDEKCNKDGAVYDVFRRAACNGHVLDDCPIDEQTKQILLENIRRYLTPSEVKCRANILLSCYTAAGIDGIKDALRAGLSASTPLIKVKINLIASPLYTVTLTCSNQREGLAILKNALQQIQYTIEQHGGRFHVQMESKVVDDSDEKELSNMMQIAQSETSEEPGDDDDDNETVEGEEVDSDEQEYEGSSNLIKISKD